MISTPYYVIEKHQLDESINNLKKALERYWNNYIIGYSYKTNSLPWVIEYFKEKGCFAEVVSDDEYLLAKYIGYNDGNLIYNGPIKTKATMLEAIRNGCIVNLDSQRELDWLWELQDDNKHYSIGIRVNFDIEKMCPGQSVNGDEGGRFGFCYENGELYKAISKVRESGIEVVGLHLHTSSKTRSLAIYRAIAQTACQIINDYDLKLEYIDVGGGFFGGMPNKPQFEDYIKEISGLLQRYVNPQTTKLIVEPGMSVIGPNISYATSVIDVKQTSYGVFAVTDGSRTQIDPLMSKSSYFHQIEYQTDDSPLIDKLVVCGYTCMEHDRLFELHDTKKLSVGDMIIYHKVGAYTMCLTPLFIKYFPDVYVRENDQLILVRKHWTPEFYCQGTK